MLVNNRKKIGLLLTSIGAYVVLSFAWRILDISIYGDLRPNGMDTIFIIYLSILYSYNYTFTEFRGILFLVINDHVEYVGSLFVTYLVYSLAWLCLSTFVVSDTILPDITDSIIITAVIGGMVHSAYIYNNERIS